MNHFFLVTFKIFSMTFIISLTFRTFTMMHLFGNLIILILLEVYWVSWMCRLLVFNLGSVPILFIWTFFSTIFSLSSHYSYVGTLDGVSQVSEALFLFLYSFFSSECISLCFKILCQFKSVIELLYLIFHFSYFGPEFLFNIIL